MTTRTLSPVQLALDHGTIIMMGSVSEPTGHRRPNNKLKMDIQFVRRGRMSRLQLGKFLARLTNNALAQSIVDCDPQALPRYRRMAARGQRWNQKHLRIVLD